MLKVIFLISYILLKRTEVLHFQFPQKSLIFYKKLPFRLGEFNISISKRWRNQRSQAAKVGIAIGFYRSNSTCSKIWPAGDRAARRSWSSKRKSSECSLCLGFCRSKSTSRKCKPGGSNRMNMRGSDRIGFSQSKSTFGRSTCSLYCVLQVIWKVRDPSVPTRIKPCQVEVLSTSDIMD